VHDLAALGLVGTQQIATRPYGGLPAPPASSKSRSTLGSGSKPTTPSPYSPASSADDGPDAATAIGTAVRGRRVVGRIGQVTNDIVSILEVACATAPSTDQA
jgi:hypothetical protein